MRPHTTANTVPSVREVLTSLFKDRRRILQSMIAVVLLMFAAAFLVHPRYDAKASLMVSIGSEYTYRPEAGQQTMVNQVEDREQILRTEIEILKSPSLQEEVVRTVGLERLYPDYVHPGIVDSARRAVQDAFKSLNRSVHTLFGTKNAVQAPRDPVQLAVDQEFYKAMGAEALKVGSVIELSFTHEDPEIAAETLNTLIEVYLRRRQSLYVDVQLPMVSDELQKASQRLAQADEQLREFKTANDISNYDAQVDILLHQKGDLERDRNDADNVLRQLSRRIGA